VKKQHTFAGDGLPLLTGTFVGSVGFLAFLVPAGFAAVDDAFFGGILGRRMHEGATRKGLWKAAVRGEISTLFDIDDKCLEKS
jgi:hypothetical protein